MRMGIILYKNEDDLRFGRFIRRPSIGYLEGYKEYNTLEDFLSAAHSLIEMAQEKTLI
jgi:hypothetical protein